MKRISLHGGHSGQFCSHAEDSLEDIVQEYIRQEFCWVGITEHIPAPTVELLYPDQFEAGETPESTFAVFANYMTEVRRLQEKYAESIVIFAAMEIEGYSGYQEFVPSLIQQFQPDYIVGSLHHCQDIAFDFSPALYAEAAEKVGGVDGLYQWYFDKQYEMLVSLKPTVVGHFDLVRIFDDDYRNRLRKPKIWRRIERNLSYISSIDSILDYNQRALLKGAEEPYISQSILELAKELKITVAPGDDSHSVDSVGSFIDDALKKLYTMEMINDIYIDTSFASLKQRLSRSL